MLANLVGALAIGLPLLLLAAFLLRRQPRPIRAFAVALVLVGTGYLLATGAAADIGRLILGTPRDAAPATKPAPAAAPAPSAAPQAPAMAPGMSGMAPAMGPSMAPAMAPAK